MNEINELDIAIIGLSGRFPKAKDIDSFWQNLKDGVESISVFSEQELLDSGISSDLLKHPNYVGARAVLSDIEMFDANFFGFSAKETEQLDPQQRLFLESAWEVIESAGYDPEKYPGLIGVYGGLELNTYLLNNIYPTFDSKNVGWYQLILNSDKDFLPTRVSYKLNLRGPAVNVQTACSTSLVAVHLACQSLLNGECNMALAGGVSIFLPQKTGYLYSEGMILSPDGHCRAFDARARGTIPGSGLGIVMLKRLEDAIADRDSIHAIIKGSAINNDGSLKVGYTAPSTKGQAAVITQAQSVAEVDAESITYIEAHGTGTIVGDPIEIAALTKVFRSSTQKQNFCAIGSLKTNMGHMGAAAGVGGLLKTVLALKHKLIPPSLHFEEPSPQIDFANSPFYVNSTLSEWKSNGNPRRAGVSSFGIGGTNAHVILEEAPLLPPSGESRGKHLLLISAKTSSALDLATANLAKHFRENPDLNLADVAYTLSCGRRAFNYRRMLVCHSATEALQELTNLDSQQIFTNNISESTDRPVIFMFPGQGSQYVNMALEVYETESVFREQVDLCSEILKPELGLDLRQILYPQHSATQSAQEKLQQTAIAQVALFVIEYALAKLWQSWGISPTAAIGHSIGEYVAATLAEVFSLETALSLVAGRGQMMQQLPTGGMLSIPLSQEQLQPLLTEKLAIAAINEPSRCVVSGDTESIEILENQLAAKNIECRRLHTSHAFHSPMMEPILNDFRNRVKQESLKPPQIPYISNLTGDWITQSQATDPNYWVQHLRQSVLFAKGMENLLQNPEQILLEVGPGRTLTSLAKRNPSIDRQQLILTSLRHPQEDKSDVAFLLTCVGNLWLGGVEVNWSRFYTQEHRYRVPLPTYPFERERYWVSPAKPGENRKLKQQQLVGKQSDISQWFYIPSWKRLPLPPTQLEKSLGNILLFIDECGLGEQLGTRLRQLGQKVICVRVGDSFTKESEGVYSLNPTQPDDYNTLLDELDEMGCLPDTIVHLWSVRLNIDSELILEKLDKSQDLGLHSLIFTAQALGKHSLANELQIIVVSNNLHEVTGNEVVCPEKATLLGAVKIIPLEYPNVSCRSVDLIISDNGINLPMKDNNQLIDQLLGELTVKSSEIVIAYRGIYRWGQTFEQVQLDQPTKTTPRLKEEGVYLITGGFGGMGFTIAQYLAETVKAKIILLGRSSFPPRQEWENWVANHGEDNAISYKIRKVQLLEKLGAEVLVISADVADYQQVKPAFTEVQKRFGHINGVFHTAGVVDYEGIIQKRTREMTESVLAPKVKGTLVLDRLLDGVELDFFILFSSSGNILYQLKFGQVGYNAANEFLDSFTYYKQNSKHNTFTVTINWDDWEEVGMSVEARKNKKHIIFQESVPTFYSMSPLEGIEVLRRVLGSPFPCLNRVIISIQNLVDLTHTLENFILNLNKYNDKTEEKKTYSRPKLLTAYIPPTNKQEKTLVDIFESVLGCNQIGINDDFFELGGDSLIATMLITQIKENFTVDINISEIFNLTTVAKFSDYINIQKQSIDSDLEKINQMLEIVENTIDD